MKPLKRIKYYTMNSWNLSTAPAYNLKIYNVIDNNLRDKVYEMLECEDFYFEINDLIHNFDIKHNHKWQAGFNGRSGGYLVLYTGGKHKDDRPFSYPGKDIDEKDVPTDVLRSFRQLALDIVKTTEYMAKNRKVEDEEYTVTRNRKVLTEI